MKDKIIFWIYGSLMNFGIAKFIQEKYDADLFAIFDLTNKPTKFFKEQKIVNFKKTWYYHDHITHSNKFDLEYLSAFEKKHKINLWLLAYNERIFYQFNEFYKFSKEEVLSILEQECRLFENIVEEVKPNFLIMPISNFHHDYLFYSICKNNGVTPLILTPSRFGNRSMISQKFDSVDEHADLTTSGKERSLEDLQKYLKGYDIFKEGLEVRTRFAKSKLGLFKATSSFLLSDNSNLKTHYTYYGRTKLKVLLFYLKYLPITRHRQSFIDKYSVSKIPNNTPFVFFPLTTDPESTLLLMVPFYTNQLELVTNIVKSLPIGYDLYVKDHPLQQTRSWRSISFYKKILELPNVKLIHPSVQPEEIIKKSSLVITVASTAAMEAAFYNKPSIVFTDVLFDRLSSVYKVKNMSDLPIIIKKALTTKVNISELNEFVNFIHNNSFEFNWSKLDMDISENFFFGGHLVDVEISTQQMENFLNIHEHEFANLVTEYLKKINQHQSLLSK